LFSKARQKNATRAGDASLQVERKIALNRTGSVMEARDLSNRDDEPDQARDEKPQAAFDGQDDARDHDRAHAQPNQKSEKKLHARDVTWLSDSFKPAYGLDVLPASPGARPAAKKRAGRIQEERGQLCPRGCRLKLLELCGQGCPRSFRVILESTLSGGAKERFEVEEKEPGTLKTPA
jgi:hypothetical protein